MLSTLLNPAPGISPRDIPGPDALFGPDLTPLLNRPALATFLNVSEKTIDRRLKDKNWDKAERYKLSLLIHLEREATEVLGDLQRAELWLQSPVPALDNRAPLTLLDTVEGYERARNTLLRQAYGMF